MFGGVRYRSCDLVCVCRVIVERVLEGVEDGRGVWYFRIALICLLFDGVRKFQDLRFRVCVGLT